MLCTIFLTVFSAHSTTTREYKADNDSLIEMYISQVNADSVESYMQYLQDMGTRFMMSPNRRNVAESIKNKFIELGADHARIDSFRCYTKINMGIIKYDTITWQYNVIGNIFGMLDVEHYSVIGAHYDDVIYPGGNPMEFAPGADDNASGVAALFESVRILSDNDFKPLYSIEFVAFAAEELMYSGNCGSQAYVDSSLAWGRGMELMINNDMIAYNEEEWDITISNYSGCEELTGLAEQITLDYTSIEPLVHESSTEAFADCLYFYEAGVPCLYFMEEEFNPFYHSNNDLVENVSIDYCAEAIKITLALITKLQDTVLTETKELSEATYKIYPNPSDGYLKVLFDSSVPDDKAAYFITDIQGRMVKQGVVNSRDIIDLRYLNKGLYFISLKVGNSISVEKIMLDSCN